MNLAKTTIDKTRTCSICGCSQSRYRCSIIVYDDHSGLPLDETEPLYACRVCFRPYIEKGSKLNEHGFERHDIERYYKSNYRWVRDWYDLPKDFFFLPLVKKKRRLT